ncbi:MAG: hypothetical protein KC425_16630 [Anaerolineales bacterium]|nr:hypothetical protein [Anaerolineales bacterium]
MRKEIEMMRVLRVPPLGKLVIESQGERYEAAAAIPNPQLKQRVLAAIGELIDFAGGYQKLVDAGVAPPLQQPEPPAPPAPAVEDGLTPTQRRFLAQLEAERDALKAKDQGAPLPAAQTAVRVRPTPEPPAAESPNIVEQIDAILQKHVSAAPELAGQKIRLRQNPAGGLQIEVNGQVYNRPREVQDPAVQRVIKLALKEWDAS